MAGERVLIVEENAAILEMLRRTFVNEGYAVLTAQNGVAALTLPQDKSVDLVVMNSRLNHVDGCMTAERIRKESRTAATPVLLMIPDTQAPQGETQDLHGADGYLLTPCPPDRLLTKARNLLEERKAKEAAEGHLRHVAQEHLEGLVESVVRSQLEEKARQMLDDLSSGLVELLDVKAKEGMTVRIEELAKEEGQKALEGIVKTKTEAIIEEVAQEVVSRVVSSLVEEKMDQIIGRFETNDLAALAGRAVDNHVSQHIDRIVDQAIQRARDVLVPDLSKNILELVESTAGKCLPRVAAEKLPTMLEAEAREAVRAALARDTSEVVNREAKAVVAPIAREMRRKINLYGTAIVIVIMSMAALTLYLQFAH